MVDVHLPTTDGRTIILSRYTEPEPDHRLARATAASDHIGWHADIAMTPALVVPTLQNQTMENGPARRFLAPSCERRAKAARRPRTESRIT
jgi:hypothetical protein